MPCRCVGVVSKHFCSIRPITPGQCEENTDSSALLVALIFPSKGLQTNLYHAVMVAEIFSVYKMHILIG